MEFVQTIQNETVAEAVSIFLVSPDDPNLLRFNVGVGYREGYHTCHYWAQDAKALTAYVAREHALVNRSRKDLESADSDIPFTGACKEYIESGEFRNILAAPLLFEDKCLGVLKIENQVGSTPESRFPNASAQLVEIMAAIIALAYQQRLYAEMWERGLSAARDARDMKSYLNKVVSILVDRLNAECASIFLKEVDAQGTECLRFIAGQGYKDGEKGYSDEFTYTVDAHSETGSLTAYVFSQPNLIAIRDTKENLALRARKGEIRYQGSCASRIRSGVFRNILAVPLMTDEGPERMGVLKVENKMTAHFGKHDEHVVIAFVKEQIVPTLKRLRLANQATDFPTPGFSLLVKSLGPSPSKPDRKKYVNQVRKLEKSNKEIRGDDCALYLGVARSTYMRYVQNVNHDGLSG